MIKGPLGVILLGVYLVLAGAAVLFGLTFAAMHIVMGLLAIVAGICLLIGR